MEKVYLVFKRELICGCDGWRDEVVNVFSSHEAAYYYCKEHYLCWFSEYSVINK